MSLKAGWGGRIRTYGTCYQKALPYHLATPHQRRSDYDEASSGSSPEFVKSAIPFHHFCVRRACNRFYWALCQQNACL